MLSILEQSNEERRQAALTKLQILDTLPEEVYQELITLAASICGTPISAITLIDKERQWFKAVSGLDVTETPRTIAFCDHTIREDSVLHIPDALKDARFSNNPLVTGDAKIRFYAGAPLILSGGIRIGALCVVDQVPRELSVEQMRSLEILAKQVVSQFELSHKYRLLEESEMRLREHKFLLDAVAGNVPGALYRSSLKADGKMELKYISEGATRFFPHDVATMTNSSGLTRESIHPLDRGDFEEKMKLSAKNLSHFVWEGRIIGPERVVNWVRVTSTPHVFNGEITWDGLLIDINNEKRLEDDIQKERILTVQAMKAAAFGKLASGLAHEINNPLAIIKGMCFVIEKKSQTASYQLSNLKADLDSIEVNANRITRIMDYLQNLSSAGQDAAFESTTIREIVDSASMMAMEKIRLHKITFEIDLPYNFDIRCRKASVARAVANLLLNSCEAIGDTAGSWIKIAIEELGGDAYIRITDSGHGIAPVHLPFIMDPFYTTKDIGEGHGLGLAVTKAVLEEHDGSLSFDIKHPHTSFVLMLPRQVKDEKKVKAS